MPTATPRSGEEAEHFIAVVVEQCDVGRIHSGLGCNPPKKRLEG